MAEVDSDLAGKITVYQGTCPLPCTDPPFKTKMFTRAEEAQNELAGHFFEQHALISVIPQQKA
jgi:hypothetical protein